MCSQMVLEIDSAIARLEFPSVFGIATLNLCFLLIAASQIKPIDNNNHLRHNQCPDRNAVTQVIRLRSINLASHHTSRVADAELYTNGCSSSVVWCHIDIEPCQVKTRAIVDCDRAEEGAEELDAVTCRAQNENVAQYAGNIRQEDERASNA